MTTSANLNNLPNTETSREQEFFEKMAMLIFKEDGILNYSRGFYEQRFTRKQLQYLKNQIELTLNSYDEHNLTDEGIKAYNDKIHYDLLRKANTPSRREIKVKQPKKGRIYLIQNTINQALKIGFSTNPKARLSQLNIASSEPLILLYDFPGTMKDEEDLHIKFKKLRLNSEWFSCSDEIISYFSFQIPF